MAGVSATRGQEEGATPAADGPAAIISQAFEKTKTATTLEDYSAVIDLCQGLQGAALSEAQTDYVKKLAAWALNKRGEARSDLAAKEATAEEASELDKLALADFEAAIALDGARWKAYHNRGVSMALAGRYDEALADFKKSLELNPGYANTWFNLGEVHYELGRLDEALSNYNQAIRLAPEDGDAYTSRANTHFTLGVREKDANRARQYFFDAVTDFNQVVRLGGNAAQAHANRGDAYRALRRWEWASNDYQRAIRLDESLARAHAGLAWLMATCPEEAYRNAEQALVHAQRAVDLGSPDEMYLFLDALAAAQANAGQFTEAEATIAKAVETAPESEKEGLAQRLEKYQKQEPYRQ
jgi:tetratricopeptide (TPR) repeat protein